MPRLSVVIAFLAWVALVQHPLPLPEGAATVAWHSAAFNGAIPLSSSIPTSDVAQLAAADDRVRVAPTTGFPARAIVHITGNRLDTGWGKCTGTLIGPRLVLTAAHCLWGVGFGADAGIVVIPGADGDAKPFGETTMQSSRIF